MAAAPTSPVHSIRADPAVHLSKLTRRTRFRNTSYGPLTMCRSTLDNTPGQTQPRGMLLKVTSKKRILRRSTRFARHDQLVIQDARNSPAFRRALSDSKLADSSRSHSCLFTDESAWPLSPHVYPRSRSHRSLGCLQLKPTDPRRALLSDVCLRPGSVSRSTQLKRGRSSCPRQSHKHRV